MERRQAIITAMGAIIGLMSGRAKSEPLGAPTSNLKVVNSIEAPPQAVSFNFDIFDKFIFTSNGESVTITGKEMFDALKSK